MATHRRALSDAAVRGRLDSLAGEESLIKAGFNFQAISSTEYSRERDVASAATKQKEKEGRSGFFGVRSLFSYTTQ